ncbi:hypothetical protein DEO72_LG11g1932 [Vigna unguiculata]|uniref:Uncharacterized protein n=1 Tax=Vigna unguiculata TaxID=3917 RepID=A0A4D6NMR0_VIGUN|nr:hypothetical protein DEO72_LG11g1932 [Vigna unguiculata]
MNTRNLELWLRLASVPVECAGCGQYGWVQMDCPPQCMVSARALSVVADRCGKMERGSLMYLIYMVVAMWMEGNESSTRCIGIHGGGHVMEME